MYKTIWNYISKHSKKSSTASVFLPVLVLEWTVLGLFAGALICLFLHNTTALVKATIVLCSGGYAGLIFGFLGRHLLYLQRCRKSSSYRHWFIQPSEYALSLMPHLISSSA